MLGLARKALIGYMKNYSGIRTPILTEKITDGDIKQREGRSNLHLLEKIPKKTNHHFVVGLFYTYEEQAQNHRAIY